MKSLMTLSFATASLFVTDYALAQSHSVIDQSRSSLSKNVFIYQALDGEFGKMKKEFKEPCNDIADQNWKGYGIRNGIGLEVFKFTQFSLSHTLLNLRSNESSLENLRGSRLAAEVAFAFSAPIANIQFGLGALAQQMEYQNIDKSASFVGSGHYYTMGINYFFSHSLSFQVSGKRSVAKNTVSGGSTNLNSMASTNDALSLGLAIWL